MGGINPNSRQRLHLLPPSTVNQLRRYLSQYGVEGDHYPSDAKQPRYGANADQPNPRLLDANLFNGLVLTPYREPKFDPHAGPFLLVSIDIAIPHQEAEAAALIEAMALIDLN